MGYERKGLKQPCDLLIGELSHTQRSLGIHFPGSRGSGGADHGSDGPTLIMSFQQVHNTALVNHSVERVPSGSHIPFWILNSQEGDACPHRRTYTIRCKQLSVLTSQSYICDCLWNGLQFGKAPMILVRLRGYNSQVTSFLSMTLPPKSLETS